MSTKLRTPKAASPQSTNPQLGDLTFDDWYETPVFEAEPDERLEQLAVSRRAPLRFFAGAMLRVAPDRPRRPRRTTAGTDSWRDRAGHLLDRWAAMETASQERLEALVLPRRWRS